MASKITKYTGAQSDFGTFLIVDDKNMPRGIRFVESVLQHPAMFVVPPDGKDHMYAGQPVTFDDDGNLIPANLERGFYGIIRRNVRRGFPATALSVGVIAGWDLDTLRAADDDLRPGKPVFLDADGDLTTDPDTGSNLQVGMITPIGDNDVVAGEAVGLAITLTGPAFKPAT